MTSSQTFLFKAYALTCGAELNDSGRFVPTLVVAKQTWPSRPRTIPVERGAHVTAEAAIASAHACGIEWVANYG